MRNSSVQSHLRFPLTRLLGNGGNVRVLRALMAYGAPLGATQLSREAGLTPQGTRLVLDSLVSQGLVGVWGQQRSQVFSVVAEHSFASALKLLFEQERARWDDLLHALNETLQARKEVRSAWLYGSVARGQDAPHSDVDIAIVLGTAGTADKIREALVALGDRFRIQFSVVALSPSDVAKLAPDDRWWTDVMRDAKVLKGVGPQQEAARCGRRVQPA